MNVFGDCVGAAIVHHLNKDHLIKPEVTDEDAKNVRHNNLTNNHHNHEH